MADRWNRKRALHKGVTHAAAPDGASPNSRPASLRHLPVTLLSGMLLGCLLLPPALLAADESPRVVTVQFDQPADPPLVKKFGVMNSGIVPFKRYERDLAAIGWLRPDSLRIDLSLGKTNATWDPPIVGGIPGAPRYSWEQIDLVARALNRNGILPYWSVGYMPAFLQRDSWRSAPTDMQMWSRVLRDFAAHFRDAGAGIGCYEVWNEPDSPECFAGTRGEYFQMFKHAALGLREGDPDAVVGGPALAFTPEWIEPFLNFVDRERLPLDFFSFHAIDTSGSQRSWGSALERLRDVRKALSASARWAATEIHLNEYHPYSGAETRRGAAVDQYPLAARLLDDFAQFLNETDLTRVHWAQLMDTGWRNEAMGLINLEGRLKPAFGALAIYSDLPVDRCQAAAPEPVRVLASASEARACAVLWNNAASDQTVAAQMNALPFTDGTLRVYRIDAQHELDAGKTNEWPVALAETLSFTGKTLAWTGQVPAKAVVYLRAQPAQAPAESARARPAQIERLHRYFPNRGSTAYADFDRHEWTARLGMAREDRALATVGVSLSRCTNALTVTLRTSGGPRKLDKNSMLGVRVDFQGRGAYTKSVVFHSGLYDPARDGTLPWGTMKPPTETVQLPSDAPWKIDLAGQAPRDWNRRVIVTFLMENCGSGSRAKFTLER